MGMWDSFMEDFIHGNWMCSKNISLSKINFIDGMESRIDLQVALPSSIAILLETRHILINKACD